MYYYPKLLVYKILFGEEPSLGVHLADDFWEEDKVKAECDMLDVPFSEEEIK